MSKTGGRVKALREKLKAQSARNTHGGYVRFSAASVDTKQAVGRYYSGDNTDERFRPIQECSAYHKMARQGEWKYSLEEQSFKADRRDGGSNRKVELQRIDTTVPEHTIKVTALKPQVMVKRPNLDNRRVSMGQTLIMANFAQPKVGVCELYRTTKTGKLQRVG